MKVDCETIRFTYLANNPERRIRGERDEFLSHQYVCYGFSVIVSNTSSVLEYENSRNPYPVKKVAMNRCLQMAVLRQDVNEAIRQTNELEHNGLKAIDVLHVACAEAASSDYLIACDKQLTNRCIGLMMKVMNPVDFVLETNSDDSG